MKNKNKFKRNIFRHTYVRRFVAGTVSASILVSCTPAYYDAYIENSIEENSSENTEFDSIAIKLSSDDVKYISLLQNLLTDIIDNPTIANDFVSHPDKYLNKYDYDGNIKLDNDLFNVALAFADRDISNAIKRNDAKSFYSLCKEKNLLKPLNGLLKNINNSDFPKDINGVNTRASLQPANNIVFPTIVIAVAAVVVYVVTYDEVYVTSYANKLSLEKLIAEENPVLNVWTLKNGSAKTHIIVDSYIESQVDDIVKIAKEQDPTYFENNSETEFRNTLKIYLAKIK